MKNNLLFRGLSGVCLVLVALLSLEACDEESIAALSQAYAPVNYILERMPDEGSIPEPDSSVTPVQYGNCASSPCVAMVTHSTFNNRQHEVSIPNHLAYARKHGHDYYFRNGTLSHCFFDQTSNNFVQRHGLYWQKITAVLDLLEKKDGAGKYIYNKVLWLDPDALITNFDVEVEGVTERAAALNGNKNPSLIIAEDGFLYSANKVNSGVFILENNEWSRNLLRRVSALFPSHKNYGAPEQRAIQDIIFGKVSFRADNLPSLVKLVDDSDYAPSELVEEAIVVPQRLLNSLYGASNLLPDSMWCAGDFVAHFAGTGSDRDKKMEALLRCLSESEDGGKSCQLQGNACH